ncbi:hypothetical protein SODALDRAFT_355976 [Sodiomyces alkalinus F11]|uniref:Uncharacterized protein n=1 Tax=Sodiomyces alkalinus (strain CBS 110278 / VKM F-3762 / F11) TaxID=1314773 RepID=A0A3N2QAG3_SODAK|nr:hypothetical protein SODALDRAFT_355976 [Sodiomyces alkalinus F11]ROT43753.1 hypothetical protein SODALDRAFT_355976 [Sodiomyces alkalinus F11]
MPKQCELLGTWESSYLTLVTANGSPVSHDPPESMMVPEASLVVYGTPGSIAEHEIKRQVTAIFSLPTSHQTCGVHLSKFTEKFTESHFLTCCVFQVSVQSSRLKESRHSMIPLSAAKVFRGRASYRNISSSSGTEMTPLDEENPDAMMNGQNIGPRYPKAVNWTSSPGSRGQESYPLAVWDMGHDVGHAAKAPTREVKVVSRDAHGGPRKSWEGKWEANRLVIFGPHCIIRLKTTQSNKFLLSRRLGTWNAGELTIFDGIVQTWEGKGERGKGGNSTNNFTGYARQPPVTSRQPGHVSTPNVRRTHGLAPQGGGENRVKNNVLPDGPDPSDILLLLRTRNPEPGLWSAGLKNNMKNASHVPTVGVACSMYDVFQYLQRTIFLAQLDQHAALKDQGSKQPAASSQPSSLLPPDDPLPESES